MEGDLQQMLPLFCACAAFYITHWRTYVTGKLHFNSCVCGSIGSAHCRSVDVTEAQWMMITIHLLTAAFGTGLWNIDLLAALGLPFQLTLKTAITLFM